ncbi:potassium voltage-gated channel protein Shaw-like [Ruditapes philippinarum]|uniref:potassium voltage-gated channel protein Shaw-like n=1 Tax=Ruditapes philippinarum TaxID=129788 RepID=UPI00295C2D9C|nr:potassium voltage-gated channel protein Shaw-like [Ruditapes philippinarum]XP_060575755.1 potassium voltage-gated channel protein Shaw-like [Ruditapes philippinarum]
MEQAVSFNSKGIIKLNVGGTIFQCYAGTLKTFPDSVLAHLDENADHYVADTNEYFFDRDPLTFYHILNASRKGSIHLPKDMCGTTFREELEFWKISPRFVAPCCWEALHKSEEDVSTMQKLIQNIKQNTNTCLLLKPDVDLKQRIWLFLDEPDSSKYAYVWGVFVSLLIVLSTISMAMSTLKQFCAEFTESEMEVIKSMSSVFKLSNATFDKIAKRSPIFVYTDFIIHFILTFELLVTFVVCPEKKSFSKCFTRLSVAIGYMAFWISFIMELNLSKLDTVVKMISYIVIKHLVILMLARLFYLSKCVPAFNIMGLTFRSSIPEFKVLLFMLCLLVCIFGTVMYVVEFTQNSQFNNMFTAMYWALITLTTVGYGHYIPNSDFGHVIAATCAVCGVVSLALPIGIIASSFHTFYHYQKYARKHVNLFGKVTICPHGKS